MGEIRTTKPRALGKRVAAYARVSLETERLSHSLWAQTRYYDKIIEKKPGWRFAGIYADSFISGTETVHRAEFQRMLNDCENGRIDVVLCKSISRFARNTVDLLETVRYLKELGVEVRFEKENINSLSGDGELMLSILASFAQEESRSISENVKWGIRRRFRQGSAEMRNKSVFGYRHDGEKYVVFEEEAEIVRLIFRSYIDGMPLRKITGMLDEMGAKTWRGFDFSHNPINYIVHNEIYIGNIIMQKFYVKDFITHVKVQNRGELPIYRVCGCHEPIIDEETFRAAQEESARRAASRQACRYTRKLVCGKCGKFYTRRTNNGKYACWHCRSCSNVKLKEDKLNELFGMTDEEFSENVPKIEVFEDGRLSIKFSDGRTEIWQYK